MTAVERHRLYVESTVRTGLAIAKAHHTMADADFEVAVVRMADAIRLAVEEEREICAQMANDRDAPLIADAIRGRTAFPDSR